MKTVYYTVVIPWRGFRCFTLSVRVGDGERGRHRVVIPWRGFRCFTLTTHERRPEMATIQVWVVIPWRGFRCFTLAVMEASKSLPEAEKL